MSALRSTPGSISRSKSLGKTSITYESSLNLKRLSKSTTKVKAIVQAPKALVFYEGIDVTPISLNPYVYEATKERQVSIHDNLNKDTSSFLNDSFKGSSLTRGESQRFQSNVMQQKQEVENVFRTKSTVTSAYFGEDIVLPDMGRADVPMLYDLDSESVDESKAEPPVADHLSLILQETDTVFLLDMPSCTVPRASDEANDVEEDNRNYDYLTKGKGRNRRVLNVAVQTLPILLKARDAETQKARVGNNTTYVSIWEMYDTYKENGAQEEDDDHISTQEEADDLGFESLEHKLKDESSMESFRMPSDEKELITIVRSKAFQDALIVLERILGNNCYGDQQKRFKGLSDPDVFREDIEYKYRLQLLWTFANDDTEDKCVTELAFNSFNEDIVTVAYGKYFYNERTCKGMVMIWNIKNPQQPERKYDFPVAVTALAFSKFYPNLLAVGFYNGDLQILDVSKREVSAIRQDSSCFEPAWSLTWFQQGEEEDLMVCYGDGKVCRYQVTMSRDLKRTQIMMTAAAEGKVKGVSYLKKCQNKDISITEYDQARCLALHPVDPFTYYVGTSEGIVHRCSTNYYNEHMDLFKAHDGAVHRMKFCPFANKIYATCGDDCRARLWIDGISEPLTTSPPSILPVLDVDWSPANPSVIASIRGPDILIWDLQRKMYEPQSVRKSGAKIFNTVCRFTRSGRCLLVGDRAGNVHVYSLEDMPIAPFFPENLISQALKRLLVTRPDLLKKLKKLGSLNFDRQSFSKYFS